jgi:hypothetical protein
LTVRDVSSWFCHFNFFNFYQNYWCGSIFVKFCIYANALSVLTSVTVFKLEAFFNRIYAPYTKYVHSIMFFYILQYFTKLQIVELRKFWWNFTCLHMICPSNSSYSFTDKSLSPLRVRRLSSIRPLTFHILINSSETTGPIWTKLWWNGPWMAPFQKCVRWSRLPTKLATKLKIEKRGDEILIVDCCFSISQNELKF